ncbi:sugar phosphate isomerase/epimerase family protein [Halobacillus sp. H74]|uniref:sugar phosphate isomerase/epimerase family protein n=1 Tax=Halobacillus sp. H74 TaxID=3457436 RepID=UPI003FCE4338
MKLATQNQEFFPEDILEKFKYIKSLGFEAFEIDGKLLVENKDEIKQAIQKTGIGVHAACGGYHGWIGDFSEAKRQNGLREITEILQSLQYVGGEGIVVPAAWGMFTYRLPPMEAPRSQEEDWRVVSDSLVQLDKVARETETTVFLEPLNRYQDHMINKVETAREYIEQNKLRNTKIIGDFYHMNIEEDNLVESLKAHKDLMTHIHLADNHRHQPGSGSINFRQCFEQLKENGYQGFLTIECRVRGENPEEEYKRSIDFLQSIL